MPESAETPKQPKPRTYRLQATVEVEIEVTDPDVISRCVNDTDGWRTKMFYDLKTRDEVLKHLAYNAISNGSTDLMYLDGWADVPWGARMTITAVEFEAQWLDVLDITDGDITDGKS